MKEKLQQFGKSMLVPISLVALGGLLLGLGGAMTSEMTVEALGINWANYEGGFAYQIFAVMSALGGAIFGNLPILYAVGVAFSLAKSEKGWAAFSAVIAFLAMQAAMQTIFAAQGHTALTTTVEALLERGYTIGEANTMNSLFTTNLGFFTYRTGVFGGIALGLLISFIHNKFYRVKLPVALSFFSGTRSIPILSLLAGGAMGMFFSVTWPFIGGLFNGAAHFVQASGLFGTFVYGIIRESLVPFGMHPLILTPINWTEIGGSMMIDGVMHHGTSAIQLAQLGAAVAEPILVRSFSGAAVINWGIYPGIAFAMYRTARPENRKKVAGLLIPAIMSTTLFGITEPILFTFIFIAPALYFATYVPIAASGIVLSEIMRVSVFEGNLKDWIPFFLRPDTLHMTPLLILIPAYAIASYFLYTFLIKKFSIMTPGREEDTEEVKLYSKADYNEKVEKKKAKDDNGLAEGIIAALGGRENIEDVDNCISRLRVVVKDAEKVADDNLWKNELQAMGVVRVNNGIQIIYGAHVASIAVDVRDALGGY